MHIDFCVLRQPEEELFLEQFTVWWSNLKFPTRIRVKAVQTSAFGDSRSIPNDPKADCSPKRVSLIIFNWNNEI